MRGNTVSRSSWVNAQNYYCSFLKSNGAAQPSDVMLYFIHRFSCGLYQANLPVVLVRESSKKTLKFSKSRLKRQREDSFFMNQDEKPVPIS